MLSIVDVIESTTVDGPGFRTAVYAAGCPHHCRGCHNPGSWDIRKGQWMTIESLFKSIMADEFANVTFSGGDPLFQPFGFTRLARQIKTHSTKTIWCYTGYRWEDIIRNPQQSALLPWIDVLVDGRYREEERSDSLIFRGSRNQRIIDVQASLHAGTVVSYHYKPFYSFKT